MSNTPSYGFNNNHTLDILLDGIPAQDYKIYMVGRPNIETASRKYSTYESEQSYGSTVTLKGFEDREITIEFNFLDDVTSFKEQYRIVKQKIFKTEYLQFNDDNLSYLVKNRTFNTATNEIAEYGEFTVTFLIAPFDYDLQTEFNLTAPASGSFVYRVGNESVIPATPLMMIKSVGTVISMNLHHEDGLQPAQTNVYLSNLPINTEIWIDFEMMIAYYFLNGVITLLPKALVNGRKVYFRPESITRITIQSANTTFTTMKIYPRTAYI